MKCLNHTLVVLGLLVVWTVELTVALHVFYHQLSPPLQSSLAPIKPADPDSPGKNSH